jgi:hypothetical protein
MPGLGHLLYLRLGDSRRARPRSRAPRGSRGRPLASRSAVPLLVERPELPDEFASVLGRSENGTCVLHDTAAHRCRAHAQLGAAAKPISCRQFPRILVHDPRVRASRSQHFCPTAAGLLFDDGPVCAVRIAKRAALEPEEGLDVRLALPPALDEDRPVDWDTLTLWEELALDVCNRAATPNQVIAVLHAARTHLPAWTPRRGPMQDWLSRYEWRGVEPPETSSTTGRRGRSSSALRSHLLCSPRHSRSETTRFGRRSASRTGPPLSARYAGTSRLAPLRAGRSTSATDSRRSCATWTRRSLSSNARRLAR